MPKRAARKPKTRRQARTQARRIFTLLPLALLFLLAATSLTGCGVESHISGLVPGRLDEPRVTSQEPVDAPGVESCRSVARLQGDRPSSAEDALAPIRLQCLTRGPSVDLSRLSGKLVLVNIWASWCGPCRKEMPLLQDANERYGDQVQFVGVDIRDEPDAAAEFLHEVGVTYPQLADPNADLPKQLRIPGIPVTLIIGPDGSVVEKHIGPFEGAALDALLQETLAEPSS